MKTLKQRMETELDTSLYLCSDFNEIESEFLRLTKEWLTEKHGELNHKIMYDPFIRREFYDELLEELK